jgi:hypothetical protein
MKDFLHWGGEHPFLFLLILCFLAAVAEAIFN